MFIYCCPKCKKFYKKEEVEREYECEFCKGALTSLKVTDTAWDAMSDEKKREVNVRAIKSAKVSVVPKDAQNYANSSDEEITTSVSISRDVSDTDIKKGTEKLIEGKEFGQSFFSDIKSPNDEIVHEKTQPVQKNKKSFSYLYFISIVCIIISFIMLGKGYYKKSVYSNSSYKPQNAYVGGDAYNYIINSNYATGYYVLSVGFGLAGVIIACTYTIATEMNNRD